MKKVGLTEEEGQKEGDLSQAILSQGGGLITARLLSGAGSEGDRTTRVIKKKMERESTGNQKKHEPCKARLTKRDFQGGGEKIHNRRG